MGIRRFNDPNTGRWAPVLAHISAVIGTDGKNLKTILEEIKNAQISFDTLTPEQKAELKGEKGDPGDSVLVGEGDLPLTHVIGDDKTKAMSQKGVVDALVNVAYINDVNGSIVVVKNGIVNTPIQRAIINLPYLENGYSTIKFVHTGKNLLPFVKPDSAVHGAMSTGSASIGTASNAWVFSIPCKRNTNYYFKQDTIGGSMVIGLSDLPAAVGTSLYNTYSMNNRDSYTINTGNHDYITVKVSNAGEFGRTKTARARINCLDSFAYTDFTMCDSYNIDLSELADTVYGGTVDLISGKVTSLYDDSGNLLSAPVSYQIESIPLVVKDDYNYFWSNAGDVSISYPINAREYINNISAHFDNEISNIQEQFEYDDVPTQNSANLINSSAAYNSLQKKINIPLSSGQPAYGTSGQVLRTLGNGSTEWADAALPTDEQTAEAVESWLDNHPEAVSTVEDSSLTKAKFSPSLIIDAVKDYVVPEMFGAVGDGVTDDTIAFQSALNSGKPVVAPGTYLVSSVVVKDTTLNIVGIIKGQVVVQNRAKVYGGKVIGNANTSCVKFESSDYSTGSTPKSKGSMDGSRLENCYLEPNSATGIGIEIYTNTHQMFDFSVGNIVITNCDKSIYFNVTNWLTKCDFENIFCKTPSYPIYIDNFDGRYAYCSDITMKNIYAQYYNGRPYNFVKVNSGSCRLILYDSFCYDYGGDCVYNLCNSIDTRITIIGESRHNILSSKFTNLPTVRNFNYLAAHATSPQYIKYDASETVPPVDYIGGVCFENFESSKIGRFAGFVSRGGTISSDSSKLFGVGCYDGRLSVLRSNDGTLENKSIVEVTTPYSGGVYTTSTLPLNPRSGATCWCSDIKMAVTYYSGTWYKPDGTALA